MPVYVSLDHDDPAQLRCFRELAERSPVALETFDRNQASPLVDRMGRRVYLTPNDRRAEPIRAALRECFLACDRLLVLIGATSADHAWVDWEIRTFHDIKQQQAGSRTWKHIRGMRLRHARGTDPGALAGRATVTIDWSPATFVRWVETNL